MYCTRTLPLPRRGLFHIIIIIIILKPFQWLAIAFYMVLPVGP